MKHRQSRTSQPCRSRRSAGRTRTGMIMPLVLIALLVVLMLGAAMANALVAQRQLVRHVEQRQQAMWLAESAMQRALYQLAQDAAYVGETWEITTDAIGPATLSTTKTGTAVIRVEDVNESQAARRVSVAVRYPSDHPLASVHHREEIVSP